MAVRQKLRKCRDTIKDWTPAALLEIVHWRRTLKHSGVKGIFRALRRLVTGKGELRDGWPRDRREFDAFWSDANMVEFYEAAPKSIIDETAMPLITVRPRRLLDVGCGTGRFLRMAGKHWAGEPVVELYGVDFSAAAIELARKAMPSARFSRSEAHELEFPDEHFDVVTSMETIEHIRHPERVVIEMMRVLAPGGLLVISVPDGDKDLVEQHINFWSIDQLRTFLEPFGKVTIRLAGDLNVVAAIEKPVAARN